MKIKRVMPVRPQQDQTTWRPSPMSRCRLSLRNTRRMWMVWAPCASWRPYGFWGWKKRPAFPWGFRTVCFWEIWMPGGTSCVLMPDFSCVRIANRGNKWTDQTKSMLQATGEWWGLPSGGYWRGGDSPGWRYRRTLNLIWPPRRPYNGFLSRKSWIEWLTKDDFILQNYWTGTL